MNKVYLIGRIATDLEIRSTTEGRKVCHFNLAVNDFNKNAIFIPCTVWEKQAENLNIYKKKGDQIAMEGQIKIDKYQDQNGQNRKNFYVLALNIEYVGSSQSNLNREETTIEITNNIDNEIPTTMTANESFEQKSMEDIGKEVFGNDYEVSDDDLPFESVF